MQKEVMKKCAACNKKFKKKDEVASTNASGGNDLLHSDCLYNFIMNQSQQNYYDTYQDYLDER